MEISSLLLFAGIYAVAVFSPGPGVAAVIARALATDARRTLPLIIGIVLGDLSWFGLVAGGLAVLAQSFQILFTLIKYAGAAYLLYLAWKMWRAPAAAAFPDAPLPLSRRDAGGQVLAGLALTLGNPKTMVFFLAVLPQVIALRELNVTAVVELCLLMASILFLVMGAYALMAVRARRFVAKPSRMQMVNRATGGVMAGVAVAVATR